MNESTACCEIVVVDDNRRLPFHLWHFLTGYTGFGIGDIRGHDPDGTSEVDTGTATASSETRHRFWDDGEPAALPTPARDAQIWWVDASRDDWRAQLQQVLDVIAPPTPSSSRLFVIDVRGGESASRETYSPQAVVGYLLQEKAVSESSWTDDVILLSSYRTSPESIDPTEGNERPSDRRLLQVHSKSTDTFSSIRARMHLKAGRNGEAAGQPGRSAAKAGGGRRQVIHLLVTGAGLEFEDHALGSSCTLGMPSTRDLLRDALSSVEGWSIDELESPKNADDEPVSSGFPVPREYASRSAHLQLHQAAADRDLDRYWNLLLEKELQRVVREGRYSHASEREAELREKFRDQLLRFDWGHLPQTITAARLNWHTWLTTNYTRFADRALAVVPPLENRPWEVIATSNEAARLQRSILHGTTPGAGPPSRGDGPRYLFKLHGDIAHQTTMAIAGYDKELSTPLSFPVDSLHAVYFVSWSYLAEVMRVARREDARVVWHVVGHGLYDRLLVDIIRRVSESAPGSSGGGPGRQEEHLYLLIDPQYPCGDSERETPARRLRKRLGEEARIHEIKLDSARYFARLHGRNLLDHDLTGGEDWEEAVGPVD